MRVFFTSSLLANISAGITTGLVNLVYSISFAALIFSGTLTYFFPQGLGIALIGATITAIVVAWRSSFPFALAGPDPNSAVILSLAAAEIASTIHKTNTEASLYPTVWATIIFSTLTTGLFLFLLGWFRLGRWVRFIPYPVIGGFLAGAGWLIACSSFKVMTGFSLSLETLPNFIQTEPLFQSVLGILFTVVLLFMLDRNKHFWALPSLLLAGIACFDGLWGLTHLFSVPLNSEDYFFKPFPQEQIWQAWQWSTFTHINWSIFIHQSSTVVAIAVIVMFSILLNATGIELATARSVDLNRELRVNGIANLINGFCGGGVSYLSIHRSLLNQQAGANSPLSAIIAGGFCGATLIFGSSFLAYLPKTILGGLLLYVGLGLLIRWVYHAWFEFPTVDYVLIVLILIIIAIWGFLQGVGAGILIACFFFIFNYGRTSGIKYTLSGTTYHSNVQRSFPQRMCLHEEAGCIYILVLHGFIFFGTANDLIDEISDRLANQELSQLQFVIFDFRLVNGIDSSAVLSFMKLKQLATNLRFDLVFTQLQPAIAHQLKQGGLITQTSSICYVFDDLDRGIEWCENRVLENKQMGDRELIPFQEQLQEFILDDALVGKLMGYLEFLEVPEGKFLFHQGDESNGLYFLESGQVSVVLELSDGQTKRLRTYNHGTILGEMGLYTYAARSASVVADRLSLLYYLSTQAFEKIEVEDPQLAASVHKFIVSLLAERLKRCEKELKDLLQ
ncbi:MAG: hypothetical protein DCF19_20415 [Pseudanabaena frigida]|uniref:Sulfate permease n=1 Tax=Pseudanabaena frigida TaxID=945775 RepID=A0A2W4VVN7_9CYAN|nr:MAG: hypothetical protein DCF19_20415 [Pseudanabaena frigida]